MSDVTVVCCWTNEAMFNDLVNSLKAQDIDYEMIAIDNRGNKGFTSCASAYNSVIDEIKTEFVIYSHQDILLNAPDVLSKFLAYLRTIGNDDILGVAGVKFEFPGVISDIGNPHVFLRDGELLSAGDMAVENGFMECDTLDECFFGGYTEHFRKFPFDSDTCNNWHLYAAEACLNAKANANAKIWVCSSDIFHRSAGHVSPKFISGFCRLCRKYSDVFPFIRTSCKGSFTDKVRLRKFVKKYYFHDAPKEFFMRTLARTPFYFALRKLYRAFKKSTGSHLSPKKIYRSKTNGCLL